MKIAGPPIKYPSALIRCSECPYGGARVGSRGNPQAPVVFVGEAPGVRELVTKIPLTGPSGEVFWQTFPGENVLGDMGIHPGDDFLILNACQCRPPVSKDTTKNMAAVARGAQACQPRLLQQVSEHPRKLVVAMGNHALRSLTSNYGHKITQVRGQLMPYAPASIGLIPVLHPAALLRGTGNYRQYRADMSFILDLLRGLPPKNPITPSWFVARTQEDVLNICNHLSSKELVACDTETGGFNHLTDEILALGLCASPESVYIIPEELIEFIAPLFRSKYTRFIWQNGKFDMRFMRRDVGKHVRCDEDTMLLSYSVDEAGGIHDLETIASDLVGAPDYKHMLEPYLPNKKTSYRVIPKPVLHHYLALDTSNTLQIFKPLRGMVRADERLEKLYTRVLMQYSEFLYKVEHRGILIRRAGVERQRKRLKKEITEAYRVIQQVARRYGAAADVNPNSPKQLAALLFDVLKMKPPRAGVRSTRKEVIAKLPAHPVLKALSEFRKASKAYSTYIVSLDRNINVDGRVHATYLIHGTRTGRLSSRGPNMQNIPRDPRLRGMYCAAPGYVFIKVDLNQAELRSLACLSGDEFLVELYRSGTRSLHKETVEEFFPGWKARGGDRHREGVDEIMRAKAVNFGVVYGRTAPSLAEEFGITVAEAQRWIDKWFARSPRAKAFIEKCRSAPQNNWTLVTAFGRKKRHWIVTQENLQSLQNEASNFPHQSIASEICTLGAVKAAPILEPFGIHPVNVVHDEAMFECPDDPKVIAWAQHVIVKCMESIAPEWGITTVPFKAEPSVGRRWSIYRKGKEYEYPYTASNPEDIYCPNLEVVEALNAFHENRSLLEAKLLPVQEARVLDSGAESEYDPDDSDWSLEDGVSSWGHYKTDGADSIAEENAT